MQISCAAEAGETQAAKRMRIRNQRPGVDAGEREKLVEYLLNRTHRHGASKAQFFASFGFTLENWESLAAALRDHGQRCEVARTRVTGFGPRYEVEGGLAMPDGRHPRLRAVCQMDNGQIAPRLITADPLEAL